MRKTLLLSVTLMLLGAGYAGAAGINLGWDDCPGGATYSSTRTFACDSDAGTNVLVGSYVAPAGIEKLSANEFALDVQAAGSVPDWWGLRNGLCRQTSLTSDYNFGEGPSTCYDYWQGDAIGAVQADPPADNHVRIRGVVAIPSINPAIRSVAEGTHVYSFKVIINNAKSVGPGACGGCATEVCIVLSSIRLNQPPPLSMPILTEAVTSAHVIWQGATASCGDLGRATPAKRQSWGAIKSLYR